MTQLQAEKLCKQVHGSGWKLEGLLTLDDGKWKIGFRHDGLGMQTWVEDREIKSDSDEAGFVEDIEQAVGLAIAQSQ